MTRVEFYDVEDHEPPIVAYDMTCIPRIGEDVSLEGADRSVLDCRVVGVRHLPMNLVFESARVAVSINRVVKVDF